MTRGAFVPAVLVLGVLLCAFAAYLFRPTEPTGEPLGPALHAVVLDVSASAERSRSGYGRWAANRLRELSREAEAAEAELAVVQFASPVEQVYGPAPPGPFLDRLEGRAAPFLPGVDRAMQTASELDAALAALQPALVDPTRAAGRLILISGDTYTGRDPGPRLRAIGRAGAGISHESLPALDRFDLALERLRVPTEVEAGAPFGGWLDYQSTGPIPEEPIELTITLEGPGGAERWPLEFRPQAGSSSVPVSLPPRAEGLHQVHVAVESVDVVPENDEVSAAVRVGEGRVVLVVNAPAGYCEVSPPGLQYVPVTAAELWTELPSADAVVGFDLSVGELPHGFEEFVGEGGGLVSLIGWKAFASLRDDLEYFPLRTAPESREPRDVILLVDGSGSMEGEPFERVKRAVFELVPAALASDRIELRLFTEVLHRVIFTSEGSTPEERRDELAPLLESKVPRGGTDIGYALQTLANARTEEDRPGLVLLLTDGVGSSISGGSLREVMGAARLDLSVLRVGHAPQGSRFLRSLLRDGESIIAAGDLSNLGELLQQEVHRHRLREEPGMTAAAGANGVDGSALLDGLPAPPEEWPRYLRAEVTEGAEALWHSSVMSEPLLAVKRHGLGLVIAAPFLPKWVTGLAPAHVETLARAAARGRPRADWELIDDGRRIVLEGAPVEWPLDLVMELHWPASEDDLAQTFGSALAEVELRPLAEGMEDPRRRRVGERPEALSRVPRGTRLVGRIVSGKEVLAVRPVLGAGAPEWSAPEVWERLVAEPGEVEPPLGRPQPAAPYVLGLGLLCLAAGALASVAGQGIAGFGRR